MIFRDDWLFPVDETGDGGDSDFRCAILALTGSDLDKDLLKKYEKSPGVIVRHPYDSPADNEKNYTRDQLIVYMAGLWSAKDTLISRRVFWSHTKRLFFCQNSERDMPGSKKYPWPHSFINDRGEFEKRIFDFRDILLFDDIAHLISCSRLWPLYPFAFIANLYLFIVIFFHSKLRKPLSEDNQLICKCLVAGRVYLKWFKFCKPNLNESVMHYWSVRNEKEYADRLAAIIG